MRKRAAVYVTDIDFLYPTLISARQLQPQAEICDCDILIFLVDIQDDLEILLRKTFEREGFRFLTMHSELFELPAGTFFQPGHVAVTSLGRLVLGKAVPSNYSDILYLDGDTQIAGDVSGLLLFDPPAGMIGAVRGSPWLERGHRDGHAKSVMTYVGSLGLDDPDSYFNAGILRFGRDDWERIGEDALRFFLQHPETCSHHDQSALNHVCAGRVVELWPGYNFHSAFQAIMDPSSYNAAIVHFTGPIKPWFSKGRFAGPYDDFDLAYPAFAYLRRRSSVQERRAERLRSLRRSFKYYAMLPKVLDSYLRLLDYSRRFAERSPGNGLINKVLQYVGNANAVRHTVSPPPRLETNRTKAGAPFVSSGERTPSRSQPDRALVETTQQYDAG